MVAQPFGVKVLLAVLFWCGALAFIGSFLARNTKLPVVLAHTAHEIGTGWLVFTLYMVLCLIIFDLFRLFNFPCKYGFYISLFLTLSLLSYGYYNYQHPKTEVFNIVINKQTVHNEQPLKVVSVSDVHLGYGTDKEELKQYVEMINAQKPDLILIGGDLIDNSVVPLYEEKMMEELMAYAATFKREKVNAKELIIGMKCGGSDGLSGITANPTVGLFSDMLVSKGGTTILTEVPEMFGAETILMNRCANKELFEKTVHLINDFKEYFIKNGQEIYENPSPGNKDGGITTLEDKSLGCTQKSGSSLVKGVLAYAEPVHTKGLNLLSAPGNDLVAATACAASGAQMVLFTTGRGTPFASPVPTVKIATNSRLAGNKSNWIDFNAGRIVTDDLPLEDAAKELFQLVLDVASGKKVKAEIAGFHDLAIFKQGVTL